ncbi:MAG: hypothetical protein H0U62_12255 [Actinobacteria bacterium]|nr:hypothetical protein [Actinomycetota bacterium]
MSPAPRVTRRTVLVAGGVGAGTLAVTGGALLVSRPGLRTRLGIGSAPQAYIPDAPQGAVHLETLDSAARGTDVQLFTAVPEGHGDGEGLPVCLVLHGASATPADFEDFGFGRFLTAAVRAGADPFVLAGASGGQLSWEAGHVPGDDPARMHDGFVDAVRALGDALPVPADPEVYAQGRHTRVFWNDHTLEAFNALAGWLRADR